MVMTLELSVGCCGVAVQKMLCVIVGFLRSANCLRNSVWVSSCPVALVFTGAVTNQVLDEFFPGDALNGSMLSLNHFFVSISLYVKATF